ncbi:MAG: glycosyltransferase family 2 protein, partial [Saprospiraceae bacterium]|nr:glycosyltransferase family 2 protein [Saprospiraceae bacterium]
MTNLSIIICTYNRSELLAFCLEALAVQSVSAVNFEVIVVNNNSIDDTAVVAAGFAGKFPNFKVVNETRQGLSHARNKGLEVAQYEWVIYLDDDAKAAPDFVERAMWMIADGRYQVFGGIFLPWYKYGRPAWFKDHYASNKKYNHIRTLTGDDFACGGIMAFEKKLLLQYGGFNPALGMSGTRVAYGEETEVQFRMRQDGIPIGYDPEWIIYHLVAPYKLNVEWFFKAGFA